LKINITDMRVILWVILALVVAVLIWAASKNAFVDNNVFGLALLAVGMCGYLIADFVYNKVRKNWEKDQMMYKSEISALKDEKEVLQKQISSATPQEEVDEMKKRLFHSEEDNRKLSNEAKSQAGDLMAANTRFDRLLVEHNKLREDNKNTLLQSNELEGFKETLATTKNKLQDLVAENEKLKAELAAKPQTKLTRVTDPSKAEIKSNGTAAVETAKLEPTPKPIAEAEPVTFLNENSNAKIEPTQRINSRSVSDENPEKSAKKTAQTLDNQAITPVSIEKNNIVSNATTPAIQPHPIYNSSDDLKVIEGIGPKIEMILKEAGIENWHQLAEVNVDNLKGILEKAGPRFRLNDPSSWAQQARLLSEGSYDKFKELTDNLLGGKVAKS
jgi:predicted flap endonuclease-1-like 5' DNA nuclease